MSRVTARTSRSIATIWPLVGKGDYGQVTYGAPYAVKCTYEQGSSRQYRDAQGQLYIPASIYWYDMPAQGLPPLNSYVALGDYSAMTGPNTVEFAQLIKNAIRQDAAVLNDNPDVMVMT